MSQKLSNCTVYFHSSPFLSGHQPNKITDKAGFDIYETDRGIEFVKGDIDELVPWTNIKSVSRRRAPKSKE